MIKTGGYKPPAVAVRQVGPGQSRKIGIIGSHGTTLLGVPWHDPSWEFWAHASVAKIVPAGRISLFIDVHPPHCFQKTRKNGFEDYYGWLQHQPTPILMQQHYKEIPQSIAYPLDEIKQEWPNVQFGSQLAYLTALALARGVTHLGYWGVEYSHDSEYRFQRGNAQMWMGIAMGRGVQVIASRASTLLRDEVDYAYETHKTPEAVAAWIEKCGWRLNKMAEREVKRENLVAMDSPAAADVARATRMQDPQFAAAMAKLALEGRHPDAPDPYQWASENAAVAAARE